MVNFADIAATIISGGATGIFGAGMQYLGNYFTDKQKQKHEREMRKLEMDSMKMESEFAIAKSSQEAQAALSLAEQETFNRSYDNDRATYTPANADPRVGWVLAGVDFLRGIVRPAITLWMAWLLVKLHNDLVEATGGVQNLSATMLEELLNNVVLTTLYIATTVILWWFGSRPQRVKGVASKS